MNQNYADISVILDRSGSMSTIQPSMEDGVNKFFEDQKKANIGKCLASLYQFDDFYEPVFEGVPIAEVPKVVLEPRSMTALLDAIGKTVTNTGSRLRPMPESDRPGKVIIVIITDGLENASTEFTLSSVREIIRVQSEVYKWEFLFLGANQDAIQVAGHMGIPYAASMTFDPSKGGIYQAAGQSPEAKKVIQSVFLGMHAVEQMLIFLYQVVRRRTVNKSEVYEGFFQAPAVKRFCEQEGIDEATAEAAKRRCPFLLNVLEACGAVTLSRSTVEVLKLLVVPCVVKPHQHEDDGVTNRRIEALQRAWPADAEAVSSEDLSILRELFGAEFLTEQYFLKQMERAEV